MADQMGGPPSPPTWAELFRLSPLLALYAITGFIGALAWVLSDSGRGLLTSLKYLVAGTLIAATLGQVVGGAVVSILIRWGIPPTGAELGSGFALGYSGLRVAGWALAAVRARLLQMGGLPPR